jgi:hypothetical protein
MILMTKHPKRKKPIKTYRKRPDCPPYKPKDLWESGALGKNKTYEGLKSDEIEHFTVGGVTFISPEWAHKVLGW